MKQLHQADFILTLVSDEGIQSIGGFRSDSGKPRTSRFVKLQCFCGSIFTTRLDIGKRAKSCRACSSKAAGTTHGKSHTRLYKIWQKMKQRATDPDYPYYENVGICKDWLDFIVFFSWATANGYHESLEIDRKNTTLGYYHNNCRWTTRTVQGRNTRRLFSHNTSGYRGVCYDSSRNKWKAYIRVNNKKHELGRFDSALLAAKAYDTYVVLNNLEHTINGVLHEPIQST